MGSLDERSCGGRLEQSDGGDWGLGLHDNLAKKMYDNGTNGDRVARRLHLDAVGPLRAGQHHSSARRTAWARSSSSVSTAVTTKVAAAVSATTTPRTSSIADTIYTIADQFGSINPAYYRFWDYDNKKPKVPTACRRAPVPLTFDLAQNYPNPFNPATQITYSLPVAAKVELKVFNVLGQVVATLVDEVKPAGAYTARFDATNFATGMYIYKIQAGSFSSVKKMLLVK